MKYSKSKNFNKKAFISHVIEIDLDLDIESYLDGRHNYRTLFFLTGI